MKAIVLHGNRDLRYRDFPEPEHLKPSEVRVQIKATGLCHTDFNEYMNGPVFVATSPHPRTGRQIPLVLGHEFSGVVIEIPVGSSLRTGDRVAINAVDGCRECQYCRQGLYAQCPSAANVGFARDGGYAERAVVPATCCYRLPDNVSDRAGALVEPLSVGLHAVRRAKLEIGSRVVVVGGGTIGLCVLQALRATGAREVFVIEKSDSKRAFAEKLGASAFINPERCDPRQAVSDLTEGLGADAAFECVGAPVTLLTAIEVTRTGGVICVAGVFQKEFAFDWNSILIREKTVTTSSAYNDEFRPVIAMLADGRLQAEPLITRVLSLADGLEALKNYESWGSGNIKMLAEIDG